jgi:hypothetical protein
MPRMASSIGSTMTSSISDGAASRQPTLIQICGRLVSGSSWIGSLISASTPNSSTMRLAAATAGGFCNENCVRRMTAPEAGAFRTHRSDARGLHGVYSGGLN